MGSLSVDNCTDTDNNGFCFAEGKSLERYSYFGYNYVSVCNCLEINAEDFPSIFNVQDIRCGDEYDSRRTQEL